MSKRNSLEEKLKILSKVCDKPQIEDSSSDSDEPLKDFNVSLPRLNQTTGKKTPLPKSSTKKPLPTRPFSFFSLEKPRGAKSNLCSDSDDDEELTEVLNFNTTIPRLKQKQQQPSTSKSALQFKKSEGQTFLENFLGKRKLFDDKSDPKPGTSKETPPPFIQDSSSDDDIFGLSPPPEKQSKPTIEDFDDNTNDSALPSNKDDDFTISQGSSEAFSQMHRFNIRPPADVKVKPGGFVEDLLKALTEAQNANLKWNYNDPSSGAKFFTVSHFETVLGSVMIFFMLDDKKCAIHLEPSNKIVKKLQVGAKIAFCPDFEPYDIDEEVLHYLGVTKIKIVH